MSRQADQALPRFSRARAYTFGGKAGIPFVLPPAPLFACLSLSRRCSRALRAPSRVFASTHAYTPPSLAHSPRDTLMSAESTYLSLGCDCSCVVRGMLAHRAHEPSPPSFTRRSSPPSGCTTCRAIGATARASRRPTWACVRATACASPTSCYCIRFAHTTATERYVSRLPHDPTQAVLIHADP